MSFKSRFFVSMLVVLLLPGLAAASDLLDLRAKSGSKIAPELLAQLETDVEKSFGQGSALEVYRVVVDLKSIETAEQLSRAFATKAAHETLRANVRQTQEAVLGAIPQKARQGFEIWNLYQSTYGFSAYADARAISALAEHGEVSYIHEMPIYVKMDAQAHAITNVDDAHAAGWTGDGVTLAIIDDGIDHDHPAFGGLSAWPNSKILGGSDFADNDSDPRVDCTAQSHGTSVTGVSAGNGGGVVGSAKDAKVVFLKIQSASICGQNGLDGDIPGAIDWAVTNRNNFTPAIKIISMSLGTTSTFTSPCSSIAEASALVAARNAGMVTLVATGNGAVSNGISSPACHPDAVSVGATYDANIGGANFGICNDSTTFADKITCYSNSDTFIDLLAPSHCAFTAQTGGGTNTCFGGTSSATPYAAGVTALLFEKDSSLTRTAAINALKNGGVNITDSRNGVTTPRVDATGSLNLVGGGSGGGPCSGCIDFSTTSTVSYSTQDNTSSGSVQVQGNGATLALTGNRWRRTTQTFTITANTTLEVEFSSTSQGEIHGIGFDQDDNISNGVRVFQLHGTQNWSGSNHDFDNYTSGTVTYTIPVGQYYTGSGFRLVFVNDKDAGTANNTSSFTNVRIFENTGGGGTCSLDDDFESGATGWTTGGSCSTGAFVVGTPSQQTSTVVTQVSGDHTSGSGNALYTASNTSAGVNDVDGGECVLDSPTWSVSDASTLSVWYFHGQRDTGDDSGDHFFLEISTNGGSSYTPFVSIGDVRTTAQWTNATASVPAGSSVRVRVRVSDGSATGDIVEGGIDDLSICEN